MDGSDEGGAVSGWHLAGIGIALFLGVVIAAVAVAQANMPTPHVGDILVMRPSGDPAGIPGLRLEARRLLVDGSLGERCILEPEAMARSGGSLVVEAHAAGSSLPYFVHWAGGATSATAAVDCGNTADLALEAQDLTRLAHAAVDPAGLRIPLAAGLPAAIGPLTPVGID